MGRAINAFRGQRSVFTTRRHAAYPALTNAFSIGLDRGHRTDDFEAGIIETPAHAMPACAAKAT